MKTIRLLLAVLALAQSGLRAQPTLTQQPTAQVVTNGGTAVFSVVVSDPGSVSYQWQFNGTNLSPLITTFAGNGNNGYSGEGGAAIYAVLRQAA